MFVFTSINSKTVLGLLTMRRTWHSYYRLCANPPATLPIDPSLVVVIVPITLFFSNQAHAATSSIMPLRSNRTQCAC